MRATASNAEHPGAVGSALLARTRCVLALLAMVAATPAALANTAHLKLTVEGSVIIDESSSGSSFAASRSYTTNGIAGRLVGLAYQGGDIGALVSLTGTVRADAQTTVTSRANLRLTPPVGASFAGGKLVVYAALSGAITGTATMDLAADVLVSSLEWEVSGADMRALMNQPGRENIEFDVVVALPAILDPTLPIVVIPTLIMNASAGIAGGGGAIQTSSADALNSGKITGFRVLNAAGDQVSGFTLSGGGKVVPELAAPMVGKAVAIEYYNATFAHYFITANTAEIAKLDDGTFVGWERTGQSFNVYTVGGTGRASVCRFFSTAFGAKSSHFYAPRGLGCEAVLANPAWQFEGDVFFTYLPDAEGGCPADNLPVYRLYNNGQGGAPNHRFTTSEAIRLEMLQDGYVAEGTGIGVGMCSPK